MAKSQEELKALKEEIETLDKKLSTLTDKEIEQVSGGAPKMQICPKCGVSYWWVHHCMKDIYK